MRIQIRPASWQRVLPCLLLSVGGAALAQTAAAPARPELPSQLSYVSPLRAYKAYADQPVESWREANDRVGRIGGWRAYAKEIRSSEPAQPDPKDAAKEPAAPAPAHDAQHGGGQR